MAEWDTAYVNDLPDSAFAYIEPGGTKDSGGLTLPRSLRHFPIRDADGKPDAAHVRNALARLSSSEFETKARPKVEAAAKELNIGEPGSGKALLPMKAEPLRDSEVADWLAGKRAQTRQDRGGAPPLDRSVLAVQHRQGVQGIPGQQTRPDPLQRLRLVEKVQGHEPRVDQDAHPPGAHGILEGVQVAIERFPPLVNGIVHRHRWRTRVHGMKILGHRLPHRPLVAHRPAGLPKAAADIAALPSPQLRR